MNLKEIEHDGYKLEQDMDDEESWFTFSGPYVDCVDITNPHLMQLVLENDEVGKHLCSIVRSIVAPLAEKIEELEDENRALDTEIEEYHKRFS